MTERPPSRLLASALYGATIAAAVAAPALIDRVARRVPPPVAESAVTATLVAGAWATIAGLERVRPYREDWNRSDGAESTDLFHLVVGGATTQVLGAALTTPVRSRLRRANAGRAMSPLPLPARIAVSLVVYDLYHSALHRLAHEWGPLWRLHAVHHSAPRLYWLNATRFHPLEMLLDATGENLIAAALGLDARAAVGHRVFRGIFGQIQHANVAMDSGTANAVLSSPERHRWHHSTVPAEGNTNYGALFCVWDRLVGTDYLPDGQEMTGEIGVGGMPDFPQDILGQLEAPLRWNALPA